MVRRTPRLSLVLNISLHGFPVSPLAACGHVETIAPELSSPELFLEQRKLLEEHSSCDAFEHANHCAPTVFGSKVSQDMDVVLVIADLFEFDIIPFGNFHCDLGNCERDLVVKQSFTILDGKDEVIVSIVGIVVSSLYDHGSILIWKPRVSKPSYMEPRGKPRGNPLRVL